MRAIVISMLLLLSVPAAIAQQLGGFTNLTYESQHGTQIEYLADGGKAFLWYPGNRSVLEGRWKREGARMCFAYGGNTFNPVTGHQGGGWECMPYELYRGAISERAAGDIFALQDRRAVPFRLDAKRASLESLMARAAR